MSDDRHTSAICPGQQTLFENRGDDHYLRLVLTAYWDDSAPSCEIFYLTKHPIRLNPRSIAALEQTISDALAAHASKTPARVIYNSFSGIEMTPDDVTEADFRVISGGDSTTPTNDPSTDTTTDPATVDSSPTPDAPGTDPIPPVASPDPMGTGAMEMAASTSNPPSRADDMIDFTDTKDGDDTQPKPSDPSF